MHAKGHRIRVRVSGKRRRRAASEARASSSVSRDSAAAQLHGNILPAKRNAKMHNTPRPYTYVQVYELTHEGNRYDTSCVFQEE